MEADGRGTDRARWALGWLEGELKDKDSLQERSWPRRANSSVGRRLSRLLMHFHTDFLHSVHVSFYFYTWIMARMKKKKGR